MADDIDPLMAEIEAARAAAEAEADAKLKAKRERLVKEALDRSRSQIAQAQRMREKERKEALEKEPPRDLQREDIIEKNRRKQEAFIARTKGSAPVQYNKRQIVEGVYQDEKTGWFYNADGRRVSPQEASVLIGAVQANEALSAQAAETQQVQDNKFWENELLKAEESRRPTNDATKKYMENAQALFINEIEKFKQVFDNLDRDTSVNIHKLQGQIPPGVFSNYMSRKSVVNADGDPIMGGFIHATPAQLAHLQPLLRFFMVDQEGNEDEIYFSDYTTGKYAKDIADLRAGGTINDFLKPRNQRGSDAGIKSFTWNYNNKHEGDYIIEADLQLYFGSLAELANINYLQFLFPTGGAADLAKDISTKSKSVRKKEEKRSTGRGNTQQDALHRLTEKVTKYAEVLSEGNKKIRTLSDGFKEDIAAKKREFRQLKVVVGWSLPQGSQKQLMQTFDNKKQYEAFRRGIKATSRAIFLNLYDYNVEFQQEGPTTLSLKYLGSSDNYLATGGSDIFGSNNYKDLNNSLIYKETEVSTAGFINYEGKIIDSNSSSNAAEVSRALANGFKIDPLKAKDPYLNTVGRGTSTQGEPTLRVTLAGLKTAQELALTQLKVANLQKKDPEDRKVAAIRRRGEYIVLLYERARNLRLRDLYSQFLRRMIDDSGVYKARIEVGDTLPAKAKIVLDPAVATERERATQIQRLEEDRQMSVPRDGSTDGVSLYKPDGDLEPESGSSTLVYYMRLGDILRSAMANADLREDISLILGNIQNKSGTEYSLYDLPITLDTFGQYFYNRVVANKLKVYPFRNFLDDILGLVARMINQNPDTAERISFDYTVVSSETSGRNMGFKLGEDNLGKIGLGEINPLKSSGVKFHHFYSVFSRRTSHKNRTGKRRQDESEGIFHYVIGTDRGLAKNFNFSRQDTQYFQEMLIESNNAEDQIQALFLPQNVNIQMFGNGVHKNGDLLFVDSRPSLGTFAGPVLGIGGYYRVIRSSHTISNRGYETTVDCVFELRVVN